MVKNRNYFGRLLHDTAIVLTDGSRIDVEGIYRTKDAAVKAARAQKGYILQSDLIARLEVEGYYYEIPTTLLRRVGTKSVDPDFEETITFKKG